ncbi:hypothetical protein BH09BAC6_BH09BAC6_31260 [soil metagenome]|jgi:ribose/xylose/arabinose/galactoside ABC-type transport system permease subunit
MYKERLIAQIKLHPFAISLYVLYIVFWIAIYFIMNSGSEQNNTAYNEIATFAGIFGIVISLPYSFTTLLLSVFDKKYSRFYLWLTYFIYLPVIGLFGVLLSW